LFSQGICAFPLSFFRPVVWRLALAPKYSGTKCRREALYHVWRAEPAEVLSLARLLGTSFVAILAGIEHFQG
jgi:hypothetical protein